MGDPENIRLHSPGECCLCDIFHRVYIFPEGGITFHHPLYRAEDNNGNVMYRRRQNNEPVEPYVQPGFWDILMQFVNELRGPVCLTAACMTAFGGIFFMLIIVFMRVLQWFGL